MTSCNLGRSVLKAIQFCPCLPEPIQLVYQGYLPASPQQPRTAFSIPLLQAYHHVWQTSVSAASSFIDGWMNFLDDRSKAPMLVRGPQSARHDLTQPFASATHLFSRITVITKSVLQHGLQLTTTDLWADRCSRCFGPAKDEVKISEEEPDVIVCMDGNFQHRHNILASKDNPAESQYPSIFVRPSEIAKHTDNRAVPPPQTNNDDDVSSFQSIIFSKVLSN